MINVKFTEWKLFQDENKGHILTIEYQVDDLNFAKNTLIYSEKEVQERGIFTNDSETLELIWNIPLITNDVQKHNFGIEANYDTKLFINGKQYVGAIA